MRTIVIGAGAWGLRTAAELVRRDHDLTLIDRHGAANSSSSSWIQGRPGHSVAPDRRSRPGPHPGPGSYRAASPACAPRSDRRHTYRDRRPKLFLDRFARRMRPRSRRRRAVDGPVRRRPTPPRRAPCSWPSLIDRNRRRMDARRLRVYPAGPGIANDAKRVGVSGRRLAKRSFRAAPKCTGVRRPGGRRRPAKSRCQGD